MHRVVGTLFLCQVPKQTGNRGAFFFFFLASHMRYELQCVCPVGKSFDITYVRLRFHTSRPESFAIYKRTREDGPWVPYQYYSGSCENTYFKMNRGFIRTGEDEQQALCTDEFSDISPLTGGNVAFSTLEGRPSAYNFDNSPVLQVGIRRVAWSQVVLPRTHGMQEDGGDGACGPPARQTAGFPSALLWTLPKRGKAVLFLSPPHPPVDVCSYVLMHLQVCPGIYKLYKFFLKLGHFNSSVCT